MSERERLRNANHDRRSSCLICELETLPIRSRNNAQSTKMFDAKLLVLCVLCSAVKILIFIETKSKSHPLCVPICAWFVFLFHPCQSDKNQDDEWHDTRHNVTVNEDVIYFRKDKITKRLKNLSNFTHPLNFSTEVGGPKGKNKISISGINSGNIWDYLFQNISPLSLRVEHFCCTGNNLWKCFLS